MLHLYLTCQRRSVANLTVKNGYPCDDDSVPGPEGIAPRPKAALLVDELRAALHVCGERRIDVRDSLSGAPIATSSSIASRIARSHFFWCVSGVSARFLAVKPYAPTWVGRERQSTCSQLSSATGEWQMLHDTESQADASAI